MVFRMWNKIEMKNKDAVRFLKSALTNFIRNERRLGASEHQIKLAIRNIARECLNK